MHSLTRKLELLQVVLLSHEDRTLTLPAELELGLTERELERPDYFPTWLHVLKPQGATGDFLGTQWQGTVKAIK